DGDVVRHEILNQAFGVAALRVHRVQRGEAVGFGALVRRLAGIVLGVDEETVLEVVDADRGGFAVGDRAQVTGDLQPQAVRLVHRRLQFGAGDVHVGLERGDVLFRPERHGLLRVLGVADGVHLDEGRVRAFQIRPGDVHVRAGQLSRIDRVLEVEVGVRLDAAGGAQGGDAHGEI